MPNMTKIKETTLAAAAALLVTVAAVGAAVGPAEMLSASPVTYADAGSGGAVRG